MPREAIRPRRGGIRRRVRELAAGAALPFALQAIYLICLPLAARGGVGDQTSFGYAYLMGSAVVAVAASSLGLVTSVPMTRVGVAAGGSPATSMPRRGLRSSRSAPQPGSSPIAGAARRARPGRGLQRRGRGRSGCSSSRWRPGWSLGWRLGDLPARLRRRPRRPATADRPRRGRGPRAGRDRRRGARRALGPRTALAVTNALALSWLLRPARRASRRPSASSRSRPGRWPRSWSPRTGSRRLVLDRGAAAAASDRPLRAGLVAAATARARRGVDATSGSSRERPGGDRRAHVERPED